MADPSRPSPVAKTEVWTLGLLGVDVVNGPLHLNDGDLLSAQNAEPFTEEGEGGIRKRLGIDEFTPTSIGTPIAAITSIPMVDNYPTFRRLVALISSSMAASSHRTSTNGTTWANLSGITTPSRIENQGVNQAVPSFNGVLYYPISDCAAMQTYNGIGVASAAPLPQSTLRPSDGLFYGPALLVLNVVVRDGAIWWAVRFPSSGGNPASIEVVYQHDPTAGSYTPVAQPFAQEAAVVGSPTADGIVDGIVYGIEVWQGRVYVQLVKQSGNGRVYSAVVGDATWTLEEEITGGIPGGLAAAEDGALYAGWTHATNSRLRKLATPGGAWADVISSGAAGSMQPVHVQGERVLVWHGNVTNLRLRESLDAGSSFSVVYTEADPFASATSPITAARLVRLGTVEFLAYGDTGAGQARIIRNSSGWAIVETHGGGPESCSLLSGV